ncbi:hypothetical protein [Brachybacterium squillarum]|uniref:hypothetical protein n=1 Tax=Brachybacterium squillarum TaxID=661979 RepID=UPI002221D8B5|nr:hypothetical protein [Brachybacterium squillarum]MCW1805275.1 hypothetical protein [Brachybacterium squillarum]
MAITPIHEHRPRAAVAPRHPAALGALAAGDCIYCGGHRPTTGTTPTDHVVGDLLATFRKQCDAVAAHGRRDPILTDQIWELLTDLDTADRRALAEVAR